MDSDLLKTFLILAKTRNFTQAAHKLFRSQSAISLQISRLETLLGKTLFSREHRSVTVTSEGEQLIPYAQRILSLEDEMMHHFKKAHDVTGEVKLGTPEDIATVFLPDILASFTKTYPHISLNVHCDLTRPLIDGYEAGHYDLVLIKQDPRSPYPGSEVVWHEPLVWVCHKEFVAHFLDKTPLLPLVLAPSPCVYRQRALEALTKEGYKWRLVVTSPSFTGIVAAVRAGLGVSVMPLKMVPSDLYILPDLPHLVDAEIALLKSLEAPEAAKALASYVSDHILIDSKI